MITNSIINIFLMIPLLVLRTIENLDINLELADEHFNAFESLVGHVNYILPMGTFVICMSIKLLIRFWNLPYAIILRIKSFIPTMGD